MRASRAACVLVALAVAGGCTKHGVVDVLMSGAHEPSAADEVRVDGWVVLAGDMHCHVLPPDNPGHVSRRLPATARIAREEGLDFVVLTPHVWGRFYGDRRQRRSVIEEQRVLSDRVRELPGDVLWIPGLEYSTRSGHATLAFADVSRVLEDVPRAEADRDPGVFFRAWVAAGGVVTVNHPLLTPVGGPIENARWDLSWRPWTDFGPWPDDIRAIHRVAQGWEAENSAVSHLRDRFALASPGTSRESVLRQLDARIPRERRRMTPVGGSDSHSHHLRAVTFVLAEQRSVSGVRGAILAGRVCLRDPWACTLEARGDGGRWVPVGGAVTAEGAVEARARGSEVAILLGGRRVAGPEPGRVVRVPVDPGVCSVLRARVDGGASGPIYVNCDFAQGDPARRDASAL